MVRRPVTCVNRDFRTKVYIRSYGKFPRDRSQATGSGGEIAQGAWKARFASSTFAGPAETTKGVSRSRQPTGRISIPPTVSLLAVRTGSRCQAGGRVDAWPVRARYSILDEHGRRTLSHGAGPPFSHGVKPALGQRCGAATCFAS